MTVSSSPKVGDIVEKILSEYFARIAGPLPARVESFAPPPVCTVDAQPVPSLPLKGELAELPVLRSIPILYPQGGGNYIVFDISPGDTVYLIPAGMTIGEWFNLGSGAPTPSQSKRRFSYSDMVALPGLSSLAEPLPATAYLAGALVLAANDIRLGGATATSPVTLANLNDSINWAQLTAWARTVEGFLNIAAPLLTTPQLPPFPAGPPTYTPTLPLWGAWPQPPPPTAAVKTKAE